MEDPWVLERQMASGNDTRGWIMTALSGIACMLGASIICIDRLIRMLPGQEDFRLQESNAFLSSSLSLSFGVMLWSALYSMLPNSKESLRKGGFSPKAASWTLFLCFLGGAAGIQVLSKIAHRYMPSHVVECDHSHEDEEESGHDHSHAHSPRPNPRHELKAHADGSVCDHHAIANGHPARPKRPHRQTEPWSPDHSRLGGSSKNGPPKRPPLASSWTNRVTSVLASSKRLCDKDGQCFGFSDPCGTNCFKIIEARGGKRVPAGGGFRGLGIFRSISTAQVQMLVPRAEHAEMLGRVDEETPLLTQSPLLTDPGNQQQNGDIGGSLSSSNGDVRKSPSPNRSSSSGSSSSSPDEHPRDHHHHVPQNAFLSIGLQTSLAIALHKLPEGFITYATNHANPSLGFSVFLALFIHNITEGFAMALPLFLAMRNRPKAVLISSVLGGISQPLGAGVAALWFKVAARRGDSEPGEGVYGVMFAVVAGIMASVALQLFSESLDLTHNRNLCMAFAFVGMGVLGFTSSLTAR